jgi:mutator mutT protein
MSEIRVAVGVVRDGEGRVLIALRPSHKHQGDLWEFPGGKIEAGESCEAALERELFEELGITVRRSLPLIGVPFHYPDKKVFLEVREVVSFEGEPHGKEGQPLRWVPTHELSQYNFPAANTPIVNSILLPDFVCITGEYSDHADLKLRIERALQRGAGMVIFRPQRIDELGMSKTLRVAGEVCAQQSVPFVVSSSVGSEFWSCADGVHFSSSHLAAIKARPIDADRWFGASCHGIDEVMQAKSLGANYVFLSPVLDTDSHPAAVTLGWDGFAAIAANAGIPVFALGGLDSGQFLRARQAGAKGIAGISAFWK